VLGEIGVLVLHLPSLAPQEILYRTAKAAMFNIVGAIGKAGPIAALDLVLALGTGLNPA
jgi:hypothetical protein